jgi:hypothetical protein
MILLADADRISPYAFRYGFANQLLQKNKLSDSTVKKLLNHEPGSKYLVCISRFNNTSTIFHTDD